ncbi:UNC-50 protein [Sistotremastrum niveocremeum HHB9708]|uniref:UNC-50 protein n=1 Tax=Sistotremastrum niveocremeum HHB9708 TaxID=1314777 RepID=A0A164YRS4_9AGAM|nr:UNC-50 protein [Sistotremastrum niveocremeum HHB9708]
MSILPTAALENGTRSSSSPPAARVPPIFRRLLKFQQMDFELAAWQLTYLCLAPRRVYRNVYFHKQTKNTWARDDPAILVLISACLAVAAIAWSVVYAFTPLQALRLVFLMIFRDFLLSGAIVASLLSFFANRALLSPPSHTTPEDSTVEWAYAFDVHINAFFPLYLTLYLAQLFLIKIVLKDNWICMWLGNTLWLAAFAQYTYGVYLGLSALPFLIRTELLLFPLLPLVATYIVSLVGFNIAKRALALYFGS